MRRKVDPLKELAGQTRTIEKFLWFPKVIKDEWRWLEKAKYTQQVIPVDVGGSMQWGYYKHKWRPIEWINK